MEAELLLKVRLLLDKPQSVFTRKQLYELLLKPDMPIDKCMTVLLSKFRTDLILHLLQRNPQSFTEVLLLQMLSSMTSPANVLRHRLSELVEVHSIVLQRDYVSLQNKMLFGYSNLMRQALKMPNLEKKQTYFELIRNNVDCLHRKGYVKMVSQAVKSFVQVFVKFIIYVPAYVDLLNSLLKIDGKDLSVIVDEERTKILDQLLIMLNNTKNKENYPLQKGCLNSMCSLCNSGKTVEFMDMLTINDALRSVEHYLYVKPVRDEARKVKSLFDELLGIKQQINRNKMIKKAVQPTGEQQRQFPQPVLIQNVIKKTNDYRQKYHQEIVPERNAKPQKNSSLMLTPERRTPITQSYIQWKSRRGGSPFLKKGEGRGGGRAYLQEQLGPSNESPLKSKAKASNYENMIEMCLSDKVRESYPAKVKVIDSKPQDKEGGEDTQRWVENDSMMSGKTVDEDDNFEEISNLIDLAYEYKFCLPREKQSEQY